MTNGKQMRRAAILFVLLCLVPLSAFAQQTLGSIDGTVTDSSGGVLQKVSVKIRNTASNLVVTAQTKDDGSFSVFDLPIGSYEVSFSRDGFKTEVHSEIFVVGNRTTTVDGKLQAGAINTEVTVTATPLLNQTDTTNGYTLGPEQIEAVPLGTGSFTQLAILAPGVSADLLGGSGTGAGLGNQNVFANGQRSTSNSFSFNGINANNLFNGNSSSQVLDNRFVLSTGENFVDATIQTSTSVFGAIGQGLPTPPPETIQELQVNTSMYDASQGANSGAHISVSTRSGTNDYHGQVYDYIQNTIFNSADFFRKEDPSLPAVPAIHYNKFGGTFGGPILKNKMFFFASYQGLRDSDELNATSKINVPTTLTNDRSAAGLAAVANADFGTNILPSQVTQQAINILSAKLPNGDFVIPNPVLPCTPTDCGTVGSVGHNVALQSTSRFTADQVNGNVDYDFSPKDRLAVKYFYQRDPNTSPFAQSSLEGFTQTLDAGAQTVSIENTVVLSPNLTWEQRGGFIREVAFANTAQALTPEGAGINVFGNPLFPGIQINNFAGNIDPNGGSLTIGSNSPFANAGAFQNQWEGESNLTWVHGRQTITTGLNWDYTQLNIVNKNNQAAKLAFDDFPSFLLGNLRTGEENTAFFNGESNRHYRANQAGAFVSDAFKVTHNLTVTAGLRWDWDGPLTEKDGLLTNFSPQTYSFDLATDTITNIGLVVAGNNKTFSTPGTSNSTLTGRQWGFAPRFGIAWSPSFLENFVVRAGFGLYYDRGEFFTEFSPGAGNGFNGPFGVTLAPPFVVPCVPKASANPIPNCGPGANTPTIANPFGTAAPPPPPNNLSQVAALLPNLTELENGASPFLFGGYDPKNSIPYSENWTLDLQWQPINTLLLDLGYVGNRGLHGTIPLPFNQPLTATATNPVNGQTSSYGYNAGPLEVFNTSTGGNTDLRVPFVGYSPNSVFYEAVGKSNYDALQFQVTKRLSHGLQISGSYTFSHSLDEQSGLGLFFNGNDPRNLHSAYGNSDFDRTHVLAISYIYSFPTVAHATGFLNVIANGWGIAGITVAQSGQPFSIIDFSGGAGSLSFSTNDFVTNPIIGLAPGFTAKTAMLQGTTGVNANLPTLNANAFLPLLIPAGTDGVPLDDPFESAFSNSGRNIFRGPFQTRFDFGVSKNFNLSERFGLRFDAQIFNLFNHPSFDTPFNNPSFNPFFANPPTYSQSCFPATGAYQCPPGGSGGTLGVIQNSIGSPRFMQFALHLTF
jgi:Carboxypeptidase regulatory-like domain